MNIFGSYVVRLSFDRFVRIQERLLKVVGTFEFFTSRHWNFSNDNICMLLNRLSLGDKEVSG